MEIELDVCTLVSWYMDCLLCLVTVYEQGEGSTYMDKTEDLLYRQKDKIYVYRGTTLCNLIPDVLV